MPLKPNQQQAALLIAQGKTQKDAASKVGVTEQTICQWAKSAEFEAYVNTLRWDVLFSARDQLQTMSQEAASTVREIMLSSSNDALRLKAALSIFDLTGMSAFKEHLWGWGIGSTEAEGVKAERNND